MDFRALLKYISALLLFGLNGIVASRMSLSSYEIVFLRTLIGSLFLIIVFLISGGRFHIRDHFKDFIYVTLSGISMGASWMFLYEAYQQIGVSFSSLLYYCGSVIVMVLSPLIFKERMTASKAIGFLVVLTGIVLVNGKASQAAFNRWGVFCGAMSALMYFFMVTFNKKSTGIIGMENAVIQLTVSFVTSAVFVLLKEGFVISPEPSDWK